jgi:nucleoid-associated protein YgaU
MVTGGTLAYFLWPDKAHTVQPTAPSANPPVSAETPPKAQPDIAVTTDTETSLPSQERAGDDSTGAPIPAPEPEPLPPAPVTEPATLALKAPKVSDQPDPAAENQAVWRVETDDFILTVERSQPEKPAPALAPSRPPTAGLHEMVHIVAPGDTLWHIAQQYLGDPFRYPELAALSRIENPDLIYPGDIVRIKMKKQVPKP